MMKVILLSGGSGTRLWPMSTEKHPKQFIKCLSGDQNEPVSMLQKIWSILQRQQLTQHTVIATNVSQKELIREQLGDGVDMVLEPEKRDTYPAILLAVSYLNSHQGVNRDEPVVVMPVDSMADDSFYETLSRLPDQLERSGSNLVLLGVQPTFPSEQYGYMVPFESGRLDGDERPLRISHFQEKPLRDKASALIAEGALWNCGIFCFRAGYLLDRLAHMGLPSTYEELLINYSRINKESFDYAVVEKEKHISAVQYQGNWRDLGTWCSLTKQMKTTVVGNGMVSEDCDNVHLINSTDIPIIAIGLNDIVIAASREGILVSHKSASSKLKEVLRELNGGSEAPVASNGGAWSKMLDDVVFADGTAVTTRRIHLNRGLLLNYSGSEGKKRTVAWTILNGKSRLYKNGVAIEILPGCTVTFEADDVGELNALDPLDIIECSTTFC